MSKELQEREVKSKGLARVHEIAGDLRVADSFVGNSAAFGSMQLGDIPDLGTVIKAMSICIDTLADRVATLEKGMK